MKIVKSLCIKKIFTIMVLLCMFGLVPSSVTAQKDPIILNPTNPAVSAGECNDGKDNNSNGKIDYPADSDCSSSSDKTEGESYKLLAPLPIFGSIFSASGKSFGEYLSIMFTFLVSFAGVLAVVMLIFGGIQYMSTDSLSGTESGRAKMTQAIYGLIIVLASYVILNTVNPNLVKFNFSIQGQQIEISEVGDDGTPLIIQYSGKGTCPQDCVDLLPEVPIKNSSGKKAEKVFKEKLAIFTNKIKNDGIINNGWGTTEAWAPSRTHKAQCHPKGTCIDANFTGSATAQKVKQFINQASSSGLCAIYEVQSDSARNDLIAGGVNPSNIKNYGSWISAPHFSVYGGTCK
ncbi:MAG: hypothetical protein KBC42_03295 [Candidatus Pacebacteria bacterium]|nr:hypothetical protein [Candidatus Paceibacterota bacterium]MBP9780922.1 hypothetical protein [Candidatus Paceibacterota bacterium]